METENCRLSPDFSDLPMEIIIQIFGFLGHSDLQAAGSTCKRWRYALHVPELNTRTLVKFAKTCLSDRFPPARNFLQCDRPFRYFCFDEVTVGQIQETIAHMGETATEVVFNNVDFTDKQFYATIRKLPKLQKLNITHCSQLFMTGSFLFEQNSDSKVMNLSFPNMKHLALCHNQYLSDAILLRLTTLIRAIDTLDMSGCHIAYHGALQRRFYPYDTDIRLCNPSDSILTFRFILDILAQHRQHVREINFSDTMISSAALQALCELQLTDLLRLRLASCRQFNSVGLKNLLHTQPQLVLLDLAESTCVNDDCVETIVKSVPLLEDLNISGCTAITDEGAVLLGTLKHLRRLDISRCEGIGSKGLTMGVARIQNNILHELHMTHLKVCDECIKTIACNLTELRVLNISSCIHGVNDDSVQHIIKHLRWLRVFSLEDCFKLTDAALTGINISKLQQQSQSKNSMENFNPPPTPASLSERDSLNNSIHSMKISLRSKAEEEIVQDANRKKVVLDAYAMNLTTIFDIDGYNIQQMRGLRTLNLKGCNRLTDVTLIYGLRFNELQRLSLSNCQQISLFGMETLLSNCGAIEELDLSDCYNINDKTIQAVTSKLKRLRALNISGCTQLTDHSLDAVLVNCKCLQTLSVYRCRRMYTDIEDRLAELPTLRNLNMDNISNYENAEIFRLKKRLDY